MKKNNEMNQDSFFEQSILNKTMVLCLLYQIEDSNRYIEMINIQIKHYQLQINLLKEDVNNNYKEAINISKEASDKGALRICMW